MTSDLLPCPVRAVGAAVRNSSQIQAFVFMLPFHLISSLVFDHISAYYFNPPILLHVSAPFFPFHRTILPHRCLIRKSDPSILHNVTLKHTSPLPRNKTAYTLCITRLWQRCLLHKCRQAGITALSIVIMQWTVIIHCLRVERGVGVSELGAVTVLRWMYYAALCEQIQF